MKKLSILMTLLTMMSMAAFAASNTGNIHLDSTVKVGATELPAGDYKVSWTGSGDNAQVTLKQGKTTTTTSARVVETRRSTDAVGTKTENGARVLTEIQFRDTTLVLNQEPATTAGR